MRAVLDFWFAPMERIDASPFDFDMSPDLTTSPALDENENDQIREDLEHYVAIQ